MSEKTIFGCIDMRNAKFQGSIKNNTPNGLGIALNLDFLMALTTWNGEQPFGPSVVIFPSRNYLFGTIKNNKLQGLCSYQTASGDAYYFNFINGVSDKIVYLSQNNLITEILAKQGKYSSEATYSLKNKDINKWETISKIVAAEVSPEMKNVRLFIKTFIENQFRDVIETAQNNGLFFVGFAYSVSLGFKLDHEDKVKQVGNFELFPRNLQFGRKYEYIHSNADTIEEGRFAAPEKVYTYKMSRIKEQVPQGEPAKEKEKNRSSEPAKEKERSSEVTKNTEQYFKRGTNFRNGFFRLTCFEDIDKYLKNVQRNVHHLSFLQYGLRVSEGQQLYVTKKYTPSQIKKQIDAVLERRNQGRPFAWTSSSEKKKEERGSTPLLEFKQISNSKPVSTRRRSNPKRYVYTEETKNEQLRRDSSRSNSRERLPQFTPYQPGQRKSKREMYYPSPTPNFERIQVPELIYLRELREREKIKEDLYDEQFRLLALDQQMMLKRRREQALLGLTFNEQRVSPNPGKPIYRPTYEPKLYIARPKDRSSNKISLEQYKNTKEDVEYPNYSKYKNRNKTPVKTLEQIYNQNREAGIKSTYIPKKYSIYEGRTEERKIQSANRNISGEKSADKKDKYVPYQPPVLETRHKRSYRYL